MSKVFTADLFCYTSLDGSLDAIFDDFDTNNIKSFFSLKNLIVIGFWMKFKEAGMVRSGEKYRMVISGRYLMTAVIYRIA